MKLKESRVREIIREELLKEIHPWNDEYFGPEDEPWENQMRDIWENEPNAKVVYMNMESGAAPAPIYGFINGQIEQVGEISTEDHLSLAHMRNEGQDSDFVKFLDDHNINYVAWGDDSIEDVNDIGVSDSYDYESDHWANELGDQLGVREPSSMPWD